jgi:hypothetical protein
LRSDLEVAERELCDTGLAFLQVAAPGNVMGAMTVTSGCGHPKNTQNFRERRAPRATTFVVTKRRDYVRFRANDGFLQTNCAFHLAP